MKHHFLILFLTSSAALSAQINSSWSGTYEGQVLEYNATLNGETNGDHWTAVIDVLGYKINLDGMIQGATCEGTMTDPQTNSSVPFTASQSGSQLTITAKETDPSTGLEQSFDLVFTASGAAIQEEETPVTTTVTEPIVKVDPSLLDRRLVGEWRYTSTYVSGDFSVATDYFMRFEPNGVVWYTDGRSAGGGSSSSFVTGELDVHQASWKAESKSLFFNYGDGWSVHAKYAVDDNNMMFTFNNGNKQIWERL